MFCETEEMDESLTPQPSANEPTGAVSLDDPPAISVCPACHSFDRVDGHADGTFGQAIPAVKMQTGLHHKIHQLENRSADRITTFAGSMKFVYIHLVWFAIWVALNVGLGAKGRAFDRFPFGLLTLIVSLEAIFLATFVMVSQNRQGARSDFRADIDFQNNVRAEVWSIHIGHQLGIDPDHVEGIVQRALADAQKRMDHAQD
jgi:uncharacterized membrane protein